MSIQAIIYGARSTTPAETAAFNRAISHGWDAANYRNAYGDNGETHSEESARRAEALFLQSAERDAYRSGFELGGYRFDVNQYADGTPAD